MFIVYDLIFLIFALIYLPVYLVRKKFHSGFLLRIGLLPGGLSLGKPIWIHAVSLGEVMAIKGLLEGLKGISDKKFVISTVTATGNKIARSLASGADFVTYLPLDLGFIVKSVIDRINPSVFIIAETEIWPNLISYLYRKGIPIIIVNARISDASFRGYLAVRFWLRPLLKKVSLFCAQSGRDAGRLLELAAPADKVLTTGNMKFDIKEQKIERLADYKLRLGLSAGDKLLVAGSTHAGEEEIILDAYKDLQRDFPSLKLVIAPRHPERSNEVAQLAWRAGFRSVFISGAPTECPTCMSNPVFILDTVGELISFYALADIVFVGGSLIRKGGHNILEPASLAKPIIFGPHMFNFNDISTLFLQNNAAIMVRNQEELKTNIAALLSDPIKAVDLGSLARQLILQNQGATMKNLDCIRKFIVR